MVARLSWHLDYSIEFVSRNCSATITIPSSEDDNTDSVTRSQRVQTPITHGITDKVAYLSEATD